MIAGSLAVATTPPAVSVVANPPVAALLLAALLNALEMFSALSCIKRPKYINDRDNNVYRQISEGCIQIVFF